MMMFILSVAIVAFVVYLLLVSFNDAASLLHPDNGPGIASPQVISIPRSPQEWLSQYIPALGRGRSLVSPTAEVGQHEWLSLLPHQGPIHMNTYPRKLFRTLLLYPNIYNKLNI